MSEKEHILDLVRRFFDIGVSKNLADLGVLQSGDDDFSFFGDTIPYDLKDHSTAVVLEELKFVSLSDYAYKMHNPKIVILDGAAVAAFEIEQSGMAVDTKSFTGRCVKIRGRGTFVFKRDGRSWKIVHIHLSAI